MKSRDGKSQRRGEKKKEDQKEKEWEERRSRCSARKGRKAAKQSVFTMICGSGGSKNRLAKAAGAEPAGQMRDEKLHAVVARSTFQSQKCKKLTGSEHFGKLRCRKSARRCGAKHMSKSKCTKHTSSGPLLEVEMSKKCTPLWRKAHFEVKMYKTHQLRTTFGSWDVEKVHTVVARSTFRSQKWKKLRGNGPLLDFQMSFRVAGARVCAPCQKWAKREGFVAFPKAMAGVGHLKRIFKDARRVAGAVQKTCSWEMLGGQGADFLRGVALHFGASDLQVCGDDFARQVPSLFRGRRSTLDRWSGKIAECIGTRPSALHSTFHFWRKSRRIASFLMLPTSKNEEVSQNSVFDVVKFKNWGSLAG